MLSSRYRFSSGLLLTSQCPGILNGPQRVDTRTLGRLLGLILWNSLSCEFISIPKEVIGMATTSEDKS